MESKKGKGNWIAQNIRISFNVILVFYDVGRDEGWTNDFAFFLYIN